METATRPGERVKAARAADWALAHGFTAFTTAELSGLFGVPADQVRRRLAVPTQRGEWVSPARGLWLPVPPEYRALGSPPATEFIGALMTHLLAQYYLGWLSAAEQFGISHQAPQVTQVAVSRRVRDRAVGRVRLRFYQRGGISQLPVLTRPGGLGSFRLSSPELTALDVASDLGLSGGLDNAAGVVVGLNDAAGLDLREVAALAPWFPASGVRRLGWILEQFADAKGLGELRAAARAFDPTPSLLDPTGERRGKRDQGWNLVLNTEIEPEE